MDGRERVPSTARKKRHGYPHPDALRIDGPYRWPAWTAASEFRAPPERRGTGTRTRTRSVSMARIDGPHGRPRASSEHRPKEEARVPAPGRAPYRWPVSMARMDGRERVPSTARKKSHGYPHPDALRIDGRYRWPAWTAASEFRAPPERRVT